MSLNAADSSTETKAMGSHVETASAGSKSDEIDFGGESSLPPPPPLTVEEEKKLWRKIDTRLMPILALMYLVSFLDRGKQNESLSGHFTHSCCRKYW
jgi:hypothetical protein